MDQRIVIAKLNIEHFRRLLEIEPEGPKRQTILSLLADQEAKLAALDPPDDPPDPPEKGKA
jgi:hypothetical protein